MRCRNVISGMLAVLFAMVLSLGVSPAVAEQEAESKESPTTADPQPTGDRSESEEAAPSQRATAGSMAAAAGSLSLQLPADDGGGARVVITDGNLKQLGEGAAFSLTGESQPVAASETRPIEGDSAAGSGGAAAVPMPGSEIPVSVAAVSAGEPAAPEGNALNDMISRFLEQQKLVLSLEARLESFDGTLEEPPPDAHYPNYHSSPQLRAPGVQNPQRAQRNQLEQRLAAERAKLETLREEALRAGVEL